jgi:alkylation response protein AidB-like acyl-CoA dehydrogenase
VDAKAHDAEGFRNQAKPFAYEDIFKVCMHALDMHGGIGIMLDFGIEKYIRDASLFLHRDATVDISKFKIVKAMFPHTAGLCAGPER